MVDSEVQLTEMFGKIVILGAVIDLFINFFVFWIGEVVENILPVYLEQNEGKQFSRLLSYIIKYRKQEVVYLKLFVQLFKLLRENAFNFKKLQKMHNKLVGSDIFKERVKYLPSENLLTKFDTNLKG